MESAKTVKREFDYYAFISYSRVDEKWARWIQGRLETYRFPTVLRREEQSLPARIFPVFRDKTDLPGGVLTEQLKHQLEESEYLIVICSPNSARAEWVEWEITYFRSLGREKNIIPLIVDGMPHAEDPAGECYTPSLLEREGESLPGVCVGELGQSKAVWQVIALLTGLRYERLERLEKRRIRRRRSMTACLTAMALVVLSVLVWYELPHSAYYWSYVYRNECPVGLAEISRQERETVHDCYRIVTRRNRVIRLERVNSAQTVTDGVFSHALDDFPVTEFSYDGKGNLDCVVKKDSAGNICLVKNYTNDLGRVEFENPYDDAGVARRPGNLISEKGSSSLSDSSSSGSNITGQSMRYEDGYLIQELYTQGSGHTPACDENGIYGKAYTRDEDGKILRVTNLGRDGRPLRMQYGTRIAYTEYEYDERGRIVRYSFYDAQGSPVANEDRVFSVQCSYEEREGRIGVRYLDAEGEPCADSDGIAQYIAICDEHGFLAELCGYDEAGKPAWQKEEGFSQILYETDQQGRMTEVLYCDADKNPVIGKRGYAGVSFKYDKRGRVVEEWYRGTDGALIYESEFCCAGMKTEYSKDDRSVRVTFYDANGEPALSNLGCVSAVKSINERGQDERYAYYDAEGNPIRIWNNCSVIAFEYGVDGLLTQKAFFDEEGLPCADWTGVSVIKYEYEDGRQVSVRYFDAMGRPCYSKGTDGNYAREEFAYNSNGRITSIRYYDIADKPVCVGGIYVEQRAYDEKSGNCILYTYCDYEGNRMQNESGYASEELIYDEKGQVIRRSRWEQNAEFVVGTDYAREINMEYDTRGNMTRIVYDYHSTDGLRHFRPLSYEYDARDNQTKQFLMGDEGEIYTNEDGIAALEWKYDERDRVVEIDYYDTEEELINGAAGYAMEKFSYDVNNRLVETSRFAVAGGKADHKLTLYDRLVYDYDVYGHETKVRHYDSQGELIADSDGVAYIEKDYDAMGNILRRTCFDRNGERIVGLDGYAVVETIYDAAGRALQHDYYDENGMPMTQESGFPARETLALTDRGDVRERTIYNEKGEFFQTKTGYPRSVYAYDGQGAEVAFWFYDCENRLVDAQVKVVYIEEVETGSRAHRACLRKSDIILQYGDWEFWGDENFQDSMFSQFDSIRRTNINGHLKVRIYREDSGTGYFVLDTEANTLYTDAGVGTANVKEYLFEDDSIGIQTGVMWLDVESVLSIREQYEDLFAL